MKLAGEQQLLRLFINEADIWEGKYLYQAVVEKIRAEGMAGCTVVKGMAGFGSSGQMHDARFEPLYLNLPVIVEVVDRSDRIAQLLPTIESMITVGMMTLEKADVQMYRAG